MRNIQQGISSAAILLLIVSSTTSIVDGKRGDDNRQQAESEGHATVWQARGSNGCAPGNNPPPGANC
jgi:hypothetical protein